MQLNLKVKRKEIEKFVEDYNAYLEKGDPKFRYPQLSGLNAVENSCVCNLLGFSLALYKTQDGEMTKYMACKMLSAIGVELEDE